MRLSLVNPLSTWGRYLGLFLSHTKNDIHFFSLKINGLLSHD